MEINLVIRRLINGAEHILSFKGREGALGCGIPVVPSREVFNSLISTLPSRLWGEAAGEAVLPHFLLNPISFPRCLLAFFCLHRHLSLALEEENPNPPLASKPPEFRPVAALGAQGGKEQCLAACPSLLLLVLFSSSCASIFIEGKGRKTQ